MELKALSIKDFTDLLGSDSPAPGGGAAAALSGAQGAALIAMVCALTLGRKKYADAQTLAQEGFDRACAQKDRFLALMQSDADAYTRFRAAYALPKSTEPEQTIRAQAIEAAASASTQTPLKVMREAILALELTRSLLGRTNPSVVSDLGAAALSLQAALHTAWLNVKINLPSLPPELAEQCCIDGEALLAQGTALAEQIVSEVSQAIG